MLTQKLILTPEIELNLYGKNDSDTGVGSGFSDVEAGLRLRYEMRREFAPYAHPGSLNDCHVCLLRSLNNRNLPYIAEGYFQVIR